jgi:cation diffusion facilitator family transporter
LGFKISSKPEDKCHPYGHARFEYITDLIVTALVIFICFSLLKESIQKIISKEATAYNNYILIILSSAIIVKILQVIFYMKANKFLKSNSIAAVIIETRNDVITTSAILMASVISKIINFNLDGYVGLIVSLIIMYSCFKLLKDVINPLMGVKPDKDFTDKIINKLKVYDICGYHDLIIHNYGYNHSYATLHIELPCKMNMIDSHNIADKIERDFKDEMNIQLVIHIDPVITDEETNKIKNLVCGIVEEKTEILNIHDFRILKNGNLIKLFFDVVVNDDFKEPKEDLQTFIDNRLSAININYHSIINIDRIYLG